MALFQFASATSPIPLSALDNNFNVVVDMGNSIQTTLNSMSANVNQVLSNVNSLTTQVSSLTTQVSSVTTQVGSLSSQVQSISAITEDLHWSIMPWVFTVDPVQLNSSLSFSSTTIPASSTFFLGSITISPSLPTSFTSATLPSWSALLGNLLSSGDTIIVFYGSGTSSVLVNNTQVSYSNLVGPSPSWTVSYYAVNSSTSDITVATETSSYRNLHLTWNGVAP